MNTTITDKQTVDMIRFLEEKYQKQLLEGFGIHSVDMVEYSKIRLEGLQTIAKMQDDGMTI